jgi:hypothetical protein
MAIKSITELKSKFESGDWPRSSDYVDLIDTLASLPIETWDGGDIVSNTDYLSYGETIRDAEEEGVDGGSL